MISLFRSGFLLALWLFFQGVSLASPPFQEEGDVSEQHTPKVHSLDFDRFLEEYQREKALLDERVKKLEEDNQLLKTENNLFRATLSRFEELLNSRVLAKAKKFPDCVMLRTRVKPIPLKNKTTQAQLIVNKSTRAPVPYYSIESVYPDDEVLADRSRNKAVELRFTGYGTFDGEHFQGDEFQEKQLLGYGEHVVLRKEFRVQTAPLLLQKNIRNDAGAWIITSPYGQKIRETTPIMGYGGYFYKERPDIDKIQPVFAVLSSVGDDTYVKLYSLQHLEQERIRPPEGGMKGGSHWYFTEGLPSDQYISLGDSVRAGRAKIVLQHQITKEEVIYVSKDYKQSRGKSKVDITFMREKVEESSTSDSEESLDSEEGSSSSTNENEGEESPEKEERPSSSKEENNSSRQESSFVGEEEALEIHSSETSSASPLEKEKSSLQDVSEQEDTRGRSKERGSGQEKRARSWSPRPWDMSDMGRTIAEDPQQAIEDAVAIGNITAEVLVPGYDATQGWARGEYSGLEALSLAGLELMPMGKIVKATGKTVQTIGHAIQKTEKVLDETPGKNLLSHETNKGFYDLRVIREYLENKYPGRMSSSTVPDSKLKNVKLAGQRHPKTGIVFDQRGFPIFDHHVRYDTKISREVFIIKDSQKHMRAATADLKRQIEIGRIDKNLFTEVQLRDIALGKAKINGLTWHHHQDQGRMQLIPQDLHQRVGHIGGINAWNFKDK